MFDRFTERAKKVIQLGKEEAERLHQPALDTEHLLMGLIREGTGMGVRILLKMNVDPDHLMQQLERRIYAPTRPSFMRREIPFSDLAKRVLGTAILEAKHMGHNYVGTEHLLLALILEQKGRAGQVLKEMQVEYSRAKQIIMDLLGSPQTETKEPSRTPVLDSFGRDLTQLAREEKLDPVIGREDEIERMVQILCRRTKNNPVLLGEPGVGKTAIVEGLAQKIVRGELPELLSHKRIVTLDLAALVAGTKYRGQFEERLQTVLKELRKTDDVIIFIDELHTLVGAGAAEGSIDASNMLKPVLARGEVQCIGATTLDEYRKHIEKDGALERRFQTIHVHAPTVAETIEILRGLKYKYEAHHHLQFEDEAIEYAVKLSEQFITDRNLPDKAIDVIDEAGSKVRLQSLELPEHLREYEGELRTLDTMIDEAIARDRFDDLPHLKERKARVESEYRRLTKKWKEERYREKIVVTKEDVASVVSRWTGIPLVRIEEEESAKLLRMEEELHRRIIGQEEGIRAVSRAVRRSRASLKDPKKPIGSFMFLGPTGVGKTELAKALAEFLFGDEKALIRIDMSEFMEKHSVSRLVGSPPGYVGYGEGGQLTEKVRRRPYSVVLLDEIEKASPDVFNILLQVMEDGHITDSMGRFVSFKNTVIIMTSNLGARLIRRKSTLGFGSEQEEISYKGMKEKIMAEVKRTFSPEFLNRLDEIIVFHALNREQLRAIVDLQITRLNNQIADLGLYLDLTPEALAFLLERGYDPANGARPIRRVIQTYLENPLAEERLRGNIPSPARILVDVENDRLVFTAQEVSPDMLSPAEGSELQESGLNSR
jgi:ATP-dependent Clp protease ATP-binding subunit ClpC